MSTLHDPGSTGRQIISNGKEIDEIPSSGGSLLGKCTKCGSVDGYRDAFSLGSHLTLQETKYSFANTHMRVNWLTKFGRDDPLHAGLRASDTLKALIYRERCQLKNDALDLKKKLKKYVPPKFLFIEIDESKLEKAPEDKSDDVSVEDSNNGGTTDGGKAPEDNSDDISVEDTSNGGTSRGGTSNGGTSNGGTSNGGTSNGGTSDGGTTDEVSTDEGSTDEGSTDEGSTDEGSTDEDSTDDDSADDDSADEDSTDDKTSDEEDEDQTNDDVPDEDKPDKEDQDSDQEPDDEATKMSFKGKKNNDGKKSEKKKKQKKPPRNKFLLDWCTMPGGETHKSQRGVDISRYK